jgi:hypothetical protein
VYDDALAAVTVAMSTLIARMEAICNSSGERESRCNRERNCKWGSSEEKCQLSSSIRSQILAGSYSTLAVGEPSDNDGDKKELLNKHVYWYMPGVLVVAVFVLVGTVYYCLCYSNQKRLRLEKALAGESQKLVFPNPSYETGNSVNQTGADDQTSDHEGRGGQKSGSDHENFVVLAEEEC